ncbi:MAG: helix-turn-helix transcriptional regulator [Burkholderiaceae bacterium]
MSDDEESRFLNTHEVAQYLRLKERTVYELVRARQIPSVRVAGKWLFPRDLIERWLEENTDASPLAGRAQATPLVLAGSHDPLLEWAVRESGCGLALLCDGSEDGLRRIDRREAMLAAIHLFEPESGRYNVDEFDALTHRRAFVLVQWATRRQGLLVAPGSAGAPGGLADAVRAGARLIARQPGSGGRRLLDHLLAREGVDPAQVRWAQGVARSETDVATALVEGRADAGLAIESVARQHQLEFVPLHEERVDLLVRRFDWFEPPIQALMTFCASETFRARAAALPGYDASGFGRVLRNG